MSEPQDVRREQQAMTRFATKRHAEHIGYRDDFCRKCKRETLVAWGRQQGLIK